MKLVNKMLLGAAALLTVTAANYPRGLSEIYFGSANPDIRKQEALKICQQKSPAFISFLASNRQQCYREMRGVGMVATYSGVWSKPDREHMQVAED